jgi:uncharacterized integral membrane protein
MNTLQTVCWKEGYDFAFENARKNKIANLIATTNLFGAECSLNILSAEEGIKAIYFMPLLVFNYRKHADISCYTNNELSDSADSVVGGNYQYQRVFDN